MVAFERKTDSYTKEDYLSDIKPYMTKLYKLYPSLVLDIVSSQLGSGVPVSKATDEQLVELETIYTKLVDLAMDRGIYVDTNEE